MAADFGQSDDPPAKALPHQIELGSSAELFPDEWREAVIAPNFEEWLRRLFDAMIDRRQYPQYWIPTPLRPL